MMRYANGLILVLAALLLSGDPTAAQAIDRQAVVARHCPHYSEPTPEAPLQVGNGEFAFALDITGMQTFEPAEPTHPPLGTMAQWAWHRMPGSEQADYAATLRNYDVHGREVTYATDRTSTAAQLIRANPHRFNLAKIGLQLTHPDGRRARAEDLKHTVQKLDLWTGEVTSEFNFAGQPVVVRTVAHPSMASVAFDVESPLVASGQLAIELRFAYPAGVWGPKVDDWDATDRHTTKLEPHDGGARLVRTLDDTKYTTDVWTTGQVVEVEEPHTFNVLSRSGQRLGAVVSFLQQSPAPIELQRVEAAHYDKVQRLAAEHWQAFWQSGGVIDLSGSSDPRWRELERRTVLSQYLTAIQCAGSLPPQETGLLCNSWHGKSHLEMHWWHAAHFAQWGRIELLERSLGWYTDILPAARAIAERQGYSGVRWPKMTGPAGVSSPSDVGELLVWQQPHPIYFAELAYRANPSRQTLEQYAEIVEQTADFMADYAYYDADNDRYVLGPVLIPAQECYNGRQPPGVLNPTFELAYWRWALRAANQWRERLGLEPNEAWRKVADGIAVPHIRDGVYTAIENAPFTRRQDHPSMLAALGVLPDVGLIDRGTMRATMLDVDNEWSWDSTWGWDYPMMAMTAARVGEPALAIDYLLRDTPKNHYLANGHCWQAERLPVYLPANGGLLSAVAMMAGGWDGSDAVGDAPGFPRDGSWQVRHEGLAPMP